MITVVSVMSISTEGVIRLSKKIMEAAGIKKGDTLAILKDGEELIIQIQRDTEIIWSLRGK